MSVESPPQVSALPPTWFIGFRRARLWPLSASRPSSTDLLPPSALPRSLRSLRLYPHSRPAAVRLPADAGHRAAAVVLRIHRDNSADSVGCHQSERRWLLDSLTTIGVPLPYIKTTERNLSVYSIGAIEDLETFDYSSLRRNFASVIYEGRCKASVVEHSLRPTASVQCEGDKAVSCGRKAATRASFPPCWCYMAHQCRRSRHRRAHSCYRSWINARKDSGYCRWHVNVHRLSSSGRAVSEDAAYSAYILRKLRMTSLPATSSDNVNNGS